MEVCLVNPGINPCEHPMTTTPPFGLLCLAAYLREAGIDCTVIDLGGLDVSTKDIQRVLDRERADVIGLSVVAGPFIYRALEISLEAHKRGATVVWGGHFPTLFPELCARNDQCDVAVRGEGEETLLELLRALREGDDLKGVAGLTFMNGDDVVATPDRDFIPDIDVLPLPAWDLLPDLERYVVDFYGKRGFPLVTSRGCPFRCSFCYITPMWDRKWRPRNASKVVEEIRTIQGHVPDIEAIVFAEDIFAINRHRVRQFGQVLKEDGMDIEWYCDIRADMMEQSTLELMYEAGCRHVYVGVESGSPRILEQIMKDVSRKQILEGFDAAKKVGLNTTAIFMLGLPGETREDVEATVDLARRIRATRYEFVVYVPYPGTPLYSDAIRWGFIPPKTVEGWAEVGLIEDFDRLYRTNLTLVDADFTVRRIRRLQRELSVRALLRRKARALWGVLGTT